MDRIVSTASIKDAENCRSFVVFDTETTGLYPWRDKLVEIGAVRSWNGEPVETFHSMIDPGIHIPENVSQINLISWGGAEPKIDIRDWSPDHSKMGKGISLTADEIGNKTKQHILTIFYEYGYEKFFGRSEVMHLLGITASPASALIKKMIDSGIIYPIKGKGKGKYLFR